MRAFVVSMLAIAWVHFTVPVQTLAHDEPHTQIHFLSQRIKREGATQELLFARARVHIKAEHWHAARRDLQRVLRRDPKNVHAQIALGESLLHLKQFKRAERTFVNALEQDPASRRGALLLAETYRAQHKYAEAAELMDTLIAKQPRPPANLFLEQAELLERAGKHEEATATIDRGIDKHGPLATLLARGVSLRKKAPQKVIYEWLAKHQDSSQMTPGLRLDLAELATQLGKPGQANAELQKVMKHLSSLPAGRRNADAILGLEARVRELSRKLNQGR